MAGMEDQEVQASLGYIARHWGKKIKRLTSRQVYFKTLLYTFRELVKQQTESRDPHQAYHSKNLKP